MGNAASQPANANAGQQPAHTDVRLFKACIRSDKSFEWELLGENVQPHFYDINADTSSNSPTEWHLEFEGSVDYPDVVVSDGMQFQAAELKCVFSAAEGTEWWALSFPDERQFAAFHQSYNGHLFENRYQTDLSEENVQRELGVYAGGLGGGLGGGETDAQQQQWVEDMDIDEPVRAGDAHAGVRSEGRLVDRKATSELTSLVLGENDRSFVVGREGISVMKNTLHGLEDLDLEVSFDSLRLGSDRGHTPRSTRRSTGKSSPLTSCSKGILMDSEEKMNLLSSTGRSIFNIDPEKEGVVRELGFGDMSGILDIVNETKGTAEATDTFLSLAPQSVDKWDLRVAERGGLVQTMASPTVDSLSHGGGRTYKSKTKFSCIATTADGYRAVGSQDGTIRLYNDQMTQVRNSIPRAPIPLARSPARPLTPLPTPSTDLEDQHPQPRRAHRPHRRDIRRQMGPRHDQDLHHRHQDDVQRRQQRAVRLHVPPRQPRPKAPPAHAQARGSRLHQQRALRKGQVQLGGQPQSEREGAVHRRDLRPIHRPVELPRRQDCQTRRRHQRTDHRAEVRPHPEVRRHPGHELHARKGARGRRRPLARLARRPHQTARMERRRRGRGGGLARPINPR